MIRENVTLILICGFMFLCGIGVGAAITDMIIGWGKEKKNEVDD